MGESKYLHFSKVYLGCTLSQLNHMVSKERWNRGRGLKLLQKAIPSLPICMKQHFWHHTVGNIWQWQLSQWISKQGLSQSLNLFFSKQLWLLLLKLQGLKVGKNLQFAQRKKHKYVGCHTLTGNNLKTTTDTAMKLGMYIKLSVRYICRNICNYFESDRSWSLQKLNFSQLKKGQI